MMIEPLCKYLKESGLFKKVSVTHTLPDPSDSDTREELPQCFLEYPIIAGEPTQIINARRQNIRYQYSILFIVNNKVTDGTEPPVNILTEESLKTLIGFQINQEYTPLNLIRGNVVHQTPTTAWWRGEFQTEKSIIPKSK